MRLFVAVPVPEELRGKVAALGHEIAGEGIVSVKPKNMHLTLKFLGEVPDGGLERIVLRLGQLGFGRLTCTLKGVGVFPREDYVRVVWVGCESNGALEALAYDVSAALRGYGAEERFSAHLTIARVKRRIDPRPFLARHDGEVFGSFEADSIQLVKSILTPGGPEYITLAEFRAGSDKGAQEPLGLLLQKDRKGARENEG
jgi:RNA 2',3'-cyclic 3'-phosphodiesterase